MTDLAERKRRVEIICNTLFGKVLDSDRNTMRVEIPADMGGAAASMFGMSGLSACIVGQEARMATRRLTDMDKRTVFDHAAQDLMAFYTFRVSLDGHAARFEDKPNGALALTRPTPKFGG